MRGLKFVGVASQSAAVVLSIGLVGWYAYGGSWLAAVWGVTAALGAFTLRNMIKTP
jgi:hypothetical protein